MFTGIDIGENGIGKWLVVACRMEVLPEMPRVVYFMLCFKHGYTRLTIAKTTKIPVESSCGLHDCLAVVDIISAVRVSAFILAAVRVS